VGGVVTAAQVEQINTVRPEEFWSVVYPSEEDINNALAEAKAKAKAEAEAEAQK
jgi:hypothetical protein